MDELLLLESLQEAIALLCRKRTELAHGSDAVFAKVYHAEKYLSQEVEQILSAE